MGVVWEPYLEPRVLCDMGKLFPNSQIPHDESREGKSVQASI